MITRVLAIETSCDETSAAVVESVVSTGVTHATPQLRSLVIYSQDVHSLFGGVVPEIASRAHLAAIVPVVDAAMTDAGVTVRDLSGVCVTHAPGLVGALLVGTSFAKGLAIAAGIPVVAVHHMEGHLFATLLEHPDAVPPFIALLVSGGHTLLIDVADWGDYTLLGETRDDAAGEAFDKVAKLLGLPYPGGAPLEKLAATVASHPAASSASSAQSRQPSSPTPASSSPARHRFARPMVRGNSRPGDADYFDLSFSGIKTAVLNAVRDAESAGMLDADRAPIARAFQDAMVDTLTIKVERALEYAGRKRVVLGGGVACNGALRHTMHERLAPRGVDVYAPSPRLATDNAAMIGAAGLFRFARGEFADSAFTARASLELPGLRRLRDR